MKQRGSNQSGNALFLILIAIFLLGGLTALMSRSNSDSDDVGGAEQISIIVSDIIKQAASIETAVQQLRSRGCSENDINLYVAPPGSLPANPLAPTNNSCDVFHAKGGAITHKKIPTSILTNTTNYYTNWHSDQDHCVYGVGTGTTTCTLAQQELRVVLAALKPEICAELNRQLGVTVGGDAIPSDSDGFNEWTTGQFYTSGGGLTNKILGDTGNAPAAKLQYKKAACFMDTDGSAINTYSFYQVIIAR